MKKIHDTKSVAEHTGCAPFLRPSILPKLAKCGHFRSKAGDSKEAARGTKLDGLFRECITGDMQAAKWLGADTAKLDWALKEARDCAAPFPLEARESELRIKACGMEGTADLLCADREWSADLKTGQERDYMAQQAAYALGFMDRFETDEWVVYLLYCDLQKIVRLDFTRESANAEVQHALAKYHGDEPPTLNEYCGWCEHSFTCPARRAALGILPEFRDLDPSATDSVTLKAFIQAVAILEAYSEMARKTLLERAKFGQKTEGVSLCNGRRTALVSVEANLEAFEKVPREKLLQHLIGLGMIAETSAKELLGEAFHAEMVQESRGPEYIRIK